MSERVKCIHMEVGDLFHAKLSKKAESAGMKVSTFARLILICALKDGYYKKVSVPEFLFNSQIAKKKK